MINYRKHIDDFFREKLGNYKETPPPEVWEELSGRLDGLTPAVPGSPYKWLRHIAIISLLVVMTITVTKKLNPTTDALVAANDNNTTTVAAKGNGAVTYKSSSSLNTVAAPDATTNVSEPTAPAATIGASNNSINDQQSNSAPDQDENIALAAAPARKSNGRKLRNNNRQTANALNNHPSPFRQQANGSWTGEKPTESTSYHEKNSTATNNDLNKAPKTSPELTLSGNSTGNEIVSGNTSAEGKAKATPDAKEDAATKAAEAKKDLSAEVKLKKVNLGFNRFEAGIKGGFETGMSEYPAQKVVVAPYLQFNITPKVAIMTQPAIKYASVRTRNLNGTQSYYDNQEINNTRTTIKDSNIVGGGWVYTYTTKFAYNQSHDSVVKSYTYGGNYFEFEIPLLVKYSISSKVSVYGGVNVVYNKFNGYKEQTFTKKGITSSDSMIVSGNVTSTPSEFGYSAHGTPYTEYKGSPYLTQPADQIGVGYMAGFSYNCNKRWMVDGLIQQTNVKTSKNNQTNTSPNIRLSIGYKLTK